MNLELWGWNERWQQKLAALGAPEFVPARVLSENMGIYALTDGTVTWTAEVAGRLRHHARDRQELPAVGDWAAISAPPGNGRAIIHAVLPRSSCFVRKRPGTGTSEAQVLAANIDISFLFTALDGDFSVRRIERYLALAWESGAMPVILLNKADLCPNAGERVADVLAYAPGAPVIAISGLTGQGLNELAPYLQPGRTVAFLGSSGVGKSTLVNALMGTAVQRVQQVMAADQRGRHTTTQRNLFQLPNGALVLDTPGLRELQLVGADSGISAAFADIEELAESCRFRNCSHRGEPGCAIRQAIEDGTISPDRYESYCKLQREAAHVARRQDMRQHMEFARRMRLANKGSSKSKKWDLSVSLNTDAHGGY